MTIQPMRVAKAFALVLVVLVVEFLLYAMWLGTGASTEACNNGKDIWLCGDGVAQGLIVALIAWPIAALLAAVAVLVARRARQHRDRN